MNSLLPGLNTLNATLQGESSLQYKALSYTLLLLQVREIELAFQNNVANNIGDIIYLAVYTIICLVI